MKNLFIFILLLSWSLAYSQGDVTDPTFVSAWFTPSTVSNGGTVSLYIKAFDDNSGVQSFGAYLKSPSGTSQNVGGSFVQISDSVYKKDIVISQWAESGTWYMSSIAIWDSAGNDYQNQYSNSSLSPATFLVNSSSPDITDPVFVSAWFTPSTVSNGGTVSLYIKTFDDVSGVQSFGAYIESPSGTSQNVGGSFVQISDSVYKKEIVLSQWAESGTWYMSSIAIWDSADNDYQNKYSNNSLSPATFLVNSSTPDITDPVFVSAWFTPSTVSNGGTVSLYIKTFDDVSGVQSFGAYIESPSGTSQNVGGGFVQISDSVYKKDIVLTQWAESGTWYMSSIAICDSAGNDYQNQYNNCGISPATFNVNYSTNCGTNGISEIENDKQFNLKLYPNPAVEQNYISIEIPFKINHGRIVFYDLNGHEIKQVIIDGVNSKWHLSIADFPTGIFYCQLFTDDKKVHSNKIVIIK